MFTETCSYCYPVIFQLALVEREINELIHGYYGYHSKQNNNNKAVDEQTTSSSLLVATKKPLSPDDVCPICQEDLLSSPMALTHCRWA